MIESRQIYKELTSLGWVAGLAVLAFGAVKLQFPKRAFLSEIERTAGKDPEVSGNLVKVPNDSTAVIRVLIDGEPYKIRIQDGGVRGGARAVVDVLGHRDSTKFTGSARRRIFAIPGTFAEYEKE